MSNSTELTGNMEGPRKPRIGITIGDPAGIGPEISLKAVAHEQIQAICLPVLIGDAGYLEHWAKALKLPLDFSIVKAGDTWPDDFDKPVIYHLNNLLDFVEMGRDG